MIRKRIAEMLKESLERCKDEGVLPGDIEIDPLVEIPREREHGDYAAALAFLLARKARKSPEEIARSLVKHMRAEALCSEVTIAARGFINFRVRDDAFRSELAELSRTGLDPFFPGRRRAEKSTNGVCERQPHRASPHRSWKGRGRRRRTRECPAENRLSGGARVLRERRGQAD